MKTWVATLLNFFLPGAGYFVLQYKPINSALWLIGVVGLTYVEFGIKESEPTLYKIMFASVLIMNAAFALDAYKIGKLQESKTSAV